MAQTIKLKEVTAQVGLTEIQELFEAEFEGWCPVCKNATISEGEILCCDCYKKANRYHFQFCDDCP